MPNPIRSPTGTLGKMSKVQAMAAWHEIGKNVRGSCSLAYTRFLANCEVEELVEHILTLLVNGFFFTQAPFMELLESRLNIENVLIASLPSIQTVMRMLKGDTIDVVVLASEIRESKAIIREHITTQTLVQIYHLMRKSSEWG